MLKPCQGDRACFCSVVIHNAYIGINNTIYLVKDEKIDIKKNKGSFINMFDNNNTFGAECNQDPHTYMDNKYLQKQTIDDRKD